jgi:hypothetical protein
MNRLSGSTGAFHAALLAGLLSLVALGAGCDRKEKVLDVETPGGSLEVERSRDTGEIEIEAEER